MLRTFRQRAAEREGRGSRGVRSRRLPVRRLPPKTEIWMQGERAHVDRLRTVLQRAILVGRLIADRQDLVSRRCDDSGRGVAQRRGARVSAKSDSARTCAAATMRFSEFFNIAQDVLSSTSDKLPDARLRRAVDWLFDPCALGHRRRQRSGRRRAADRMSAAAPSRGVSAGLHLPAERWLRSADAGGSSDGGGSDEAAADDGALADGASAASLLGLVATLAAAPHALADGDVAGAAGAFSRAQRAELAGDHARAAEFYELADSMAPTPEALRSALRTRLAAGQRAIAAARAESLRSRYPDDAESKALADKTLDRAGRAARPLRSGVPAPRVRRDRGRRGRGRRCPAEARDLSRTRSAPDRGRLRLAARRGARRSKPRPVSRGSSSSTLRPQSSSRRRRRRRRNPDFGFQRRRRARQRRRADYRRCGSRSARW